MADQISQDPSGMPERAETTRGAPVFVPRTDIYETKESLVLLLEMPGVNGDDIDVTLEKRVLTVTGRGSQAVPKGYGLAHAEYRIGDYERAFTLSEAIDDEGIEAAMTEGVLKLILPKAKPAQAKTINVKTA